MNIFFLYILIQQFSLMYFKILSTSKVVLFCFCFRLKRRNSQILFKSFGKIDRKKLEEDVFSNLLIRSWERDADGSRVLESVPVKLLDRLLEPVPVQQLGRGRVARRARADRISLLKSDLTKRKQTCYGQSLQIFT